MKTFLLSLFCFSVSAAIYDGEFFQVKYDSDAWRIAPAHKEGDKSQALLALEEVTAFEKYHSRLTVVAEDVSKYHTENPEGLKAYYRTVADFLSSQRFQITSRKETELGGYPAFEITAHQRDFGLSYRQWVVVDGARAYLITASTRLSQKDEKVAAVKAMAESFRLVASKSR